MALEPPLELISVVNYFTNALKGRIEREIRTCWTHALSNKSLDHFHRVHSWYKKKIQKDDSVIEQRYILQMLFWMLSLFELILSGYVRTKELSRSNKKKEGASAEDYPRRHHSSFFNSLLQNVNLRDQKTPDGRKQIYDPKKLPLLRLPTPLERKVMGHIWRGFRRKPNAMPLQVPSDKRIRAIQGSLQRYMEALAVKKAFCVFIMLGTFTVHACLCVSECQSFVCVWGCSCVFGW